MSNLNYFLSNKNKVNRDFGVVLKEVQEYISSKYATLITNNVNEQKPQIISYISKYLRDYNIAVEDLSFKELVEKLYSEMAEFGVLTKYIFGIGNEEINVNSWDDIEVIKNTGERYKISESFESPQHALDTMRKMLRISGVILDNTSPTALGFLSKNIRIAVMKTPIVDEDVGVSASIRIVNAVSFQKEDLTRNGTATEEMLNFLAECLRYGVSVCIAGATSSGKTTITNWLLSTIPITKRIFTIESGSRELNLVKRDAGGKVLNSVVHTLTRSSDNANANVDQDDLLAISLRFHPDVICVGEMRGREAYTAQESARTGHVVITTVHANSCEGTYRRICTLIKKEYDVSDDTVMGLVTEAFPIIVFAKQLEDKSRKIMEVMECEILSTGERKFRTLFEYEIKENSFVDAESVILGEHKRVKPISDSLKKRFLENGMPKEKIEAMGFG